MKKEKPMCQQVQSQFQSKLKEEKGATMVEYALMVALIAVICILAVTDVGKKANAAFEGIAKSFPAATTPAP